MSDITNAIKQICEEKNLSYEAVLETIESALAAAYRKDFGEKNQNIKVEFEPETGQSKVFDVKTVVEDMPPSALEGATEGKPAPVEALEGKEEIESGAEKHAVVVMSEPETAENKEAKKSKKTKKKPVDVSTSLEKEGEIKAGTKAVAVEIAKEEEIRKFNSKTELQIKDAKLIKKTAKVGEVIKTKLEVPSDYGRMAAQTAKQVIIQKLREAEREMIFSEFKGKEHEVVAGVVQRREGRIVLVDLGKAVGVLPAEEQIMNERYRPGDRIKVYVKYVGITPRGPEILLSRTSDEILKKVFYLEIPEISNGLVEIKAVAREAGNRSKVAVTAVGENVDPIGSCVGQRGARIQTIISELGGEKIDIIEYDEDIAKFIAQALAPAKVISVELNNDGKRATAKVVEDQLSLAIGREGQNVRLAARLTGWKLDIVGEKSAVVKTDEAVAVIDDKEVKPEAKEIEAKAETGKATEIAPEAETKKNEKTETAVVPEEVKNETPAESKKKKSKKKLA